VEQGLNLPDAAALIRGDFKFEPSKPIQPPVATVTLAEIYGAQGHFKKALAMLDEVLAKEPDHETARKLRDRLSRDRAAGARAPVGGDAAGAAVFPEEPEPATSRKPIDELPAFATAHVPNDDAEPLTPRRLSKQPPAMSPVIADYDSEPKTPRQPHGAAPEVSQLESVPVAAEPSEPAGVETPSEDGAVLFRTSSTRAVVYFEITGDATNGDAPIVHVVEWRPSGSSIERVVHEFVITGSRGTVVADGLSAGAIVRAALGHRRHGRFKPLAVCAEAEGAPGGATVVWSPRPRKDYGPIAGRGAIRATV
jgi:hypothetical protein